MIDLRTKTKKYKYRIYDALLEKNIFVYGYSPLKETTKYANSCGAQKGSFNYEPTREINADYRCFNFLDKHGEKHCCVIFYEGVKATEGEKCQSN